MTPAQFIQKCLDQWEGLGTAPRTRFRLTCFVCSSVFFLPRRGFCVHKFLPSFIASAEKGGKRMFYACFNMHLKSKSIRNDSENAKGFRHRLLIHDALRKAAYFRANPCYHWRSSPTEVIFHLRTCALMTVWGGAAGTEIQTPCSQRMQYQSRGEEGSSTLYIKLVPYDKVLIPFCLIPVLIITLGWTYKIDFFLMLFWIFPSWSAKPCFSIFLYLSCFLSHCPEPILHFY